MTRRTLCCLLLAVAAALGVPLLAAAPAAASGGGNSTTAAQQLDGFAISWLPCRLGTASDFAYEWDDVQFHSRVWESGPDATGGYHEDLAIDIIRGESLTTAPRLYEFLKDYEERPEWKFVPFTFQGHPGYLGTDEAFWLVRPGVAVMMRIDRDEYGQRQLLRVAAGIHPVE